MNRKLPLYCLIIFFVLIAALVSWKVLVDRNSQKSGAFEHQEHISEVDAESPSPPVLTMNPENSAANAVAGDERNSTPTVKITLIPVLDTLFVAREDRRESSFRQWSRAGDLYLIESSVWYDLYDRDNKKIFRFPRFINADPAGKPGAIDSVGRDIIWQWMDDVSVIGVQPIIQRKSAVPPKGMDAEFPEMLPDLTRIYLYDVRKLDALYELVTPPVPEGFVVRIEGISEGGDLSLAAVSPQAYDRGDDLKDDLGHYRYLGVYRCVK